MRLIITEKNNSAKKIAQILSGGTAKEDKSYKVPYYTWSGSEGDQRTVGLKGHVVGPAFPEGYSNWQETDLHDLIDAELTTEPTDKNVVKAVRKLAKEADSIVIATDFDREGELIGLEALAEAFAANPEIVGRLAAEPGDDEGRLVQTLSTERPKIHRARYSALTKEEIERAFGDLDELSYDLAQAGAARQDIDLIWGATLTRAVSLATRRFGSNFLSVGRVQSPTLALVVERELERRAHVAKPYWEVYAKFAHPDGAFEAHHKTDKFWEEAEAKAAVAGTKSPGVVSELTARKNTRKPPTPFNTTAFTTEASSRLGITPKAAMRFAEDLYMDGFISYPRTDNTVYPASLPTRELVSALVKRPEFSAAAPLLDGDLKPTRGKKETTDHPPIYPTQAVNPEALEGPKRRVYELVARRFLATFAPPMITESTRADIEAGTEQYFVRGSVVVDAGFARDLHLRALEGPGDPQARAGPGAAARRRALDRREGDPAAVADQPGQARRDDGGARPGHEGDARRHHPEALRPRLRLQQPARALGDRDRDVQGVPQVRAADGDAGDDRRAREDHGRDRRRQAAEGRRARVQPRDAARHDHRAREAARGPRQGDLGRHGRGQVPRPLPASARRRGARTRTARRTGCGSSSCAAASASSAARATTATTRRTPTPATSPGPLPGRGYELWRLEERCSVCGKTPRLTVRGFRGRPWKLCLNDDCPTMVEMREKRAEREAAKAAAAEAKAKAEAEGGDGAKADADGKPPVVDTTRVKRGPGREVRRPQARAGQEVALLACSSRSRASTERARRRRRSCSPRARRDARCSCASRAAREASERMRELLKDPDGRARSRAPSCCSSAPRAPSSSSA